MTTAEIRLLVQIRDRLTAIAALLALIALTTGVVAGWVCLTQYRLDRIADRLRHPAAQAIERLLPPQTATRPAQYSGHSPRSDADAGQADRDIVP